MPVGEVLGATGGPGGYWNASSWGYIWSKAYGWDYIPPAGKCLTKYKVITNAQPLKPGYTWIQYGDAVVVPITLENCPTPQDGGGAG